MPAFPPWLLALLPGSLFFPGLFLLARAAFAALGGRAREHDTVLAARLVSSVQAVMASTAGYIISSSCQHVIDDTHWLASAYPPFAVPYFVYDVYAMYLCHLRRPHLKGHARPAPGAAAAAAFLRRDLLMVLHHLAMVLVCFPVATLWRQGKGDFFLGCLLMAELSTPFVCLGKVLILLGLQRSALHKLNGALLLLTFLGCRLLLFPYLYWAYGRQRGLPLWGALRGLPPLTHLAAALLLAPQLYWFGLICRGARRACRGGGAGGGGGGEGNRPP